MAVIGVRRLKAAATSAGVPTLNTGRFYDGIIWQYLTTAGGDSILSTLVTYL
jgi:hypothetical protein